MNVVIIGGGRKFGRNVAEKFKANGDNVYILSHITYGENDRHLSADFSEIYEVAYQLNFLLRDVDHIDLLLYTSNMDYGPHPSEYKNDAIIKNIKQYWQQTFNIAVVIPHIISVTALSKMTEQSKIVFMTSYMSMQLDRDYALDAAGYAGSKAAQNHLMISLAALNEVKATVYSIATHLPVEDFDQYEIVSNKIFNKLLTSSREDSGKVIQIF